MWRLLFDACLVIGPTLGYAAQFQRIRKVRSSEGFSLAVPFILITAALLRIHFWWGKQFDAALLLQAVAMLFAQLLLLKVCTTFPGPFQRGHSLLDGTLQHFWSWEDYPSYLFAVVFSSIGLTILTYLCQGLGPFFELLGYLSLLTEATLTLPQVCENARRLSVEGLSLVLVACWVVGDVAKTTYFVLTESPVQFLLCGAVQLVLDAVILLQYCLYRGRITPQSHLEEGSKL